MKAYLGLDQSLPFQFWNYLKRLATGDLGKTIEPREPFATVIFRRFPAAFILSAVAPIIAANSRSCRYCVGTETGYRSSLHLDDNE
jgi:peptide/nickel transport system permease protein